MYETIVFDLDGTLLDTLDDLADSVNVALAAFNFPTRTREEIRTFVGNGMVSLMQLACGRTDYPQFDELLWTFKRHYAAHCKDKTKAYDGIYPLLERLKADGKKLAMLSNKAHFAVKDLANDYFPNAFHTVQGENESEGIRKKPAPDALFAIMHTLGADKEKTVLIGDSEVDIQTAKNAGVDAILVSWGFRGRQFLKEHGATVIVDTTEEIIQLCGE